MTGRVKSLILAGNGHFEVVSLDEAALAPDECRIEVAAAGICSSDVPRAFERGAYFYPLVMGHEFAGTIVETGSAATGRKVGDRVTVFPLLPCFACDACAEAAYSRCRNYGYYGSRRHGGFAERVAIKSWNLVSVPAAVTLDDAALTEPTAVVVHALGAAGLLSPASASNIMGDNASHLVLGAGFLGQIAARILAQERPELRVDIVDRNGFKIELARPYVASATRLETEDDWRAFVAANRARYAVVLEAAGVPDTFRTSVELARPGGTIVWMGNISDDLVLPKALVSSLLRKELRLLGTWNSSYAGAARSDWTEALALMAGGLSPSSLVNLRTGLDGAAEALRKLDAHRRRVERHEILKALVRVR